MTMKLSRNNNILTALLALLSMLFMQAAVASYTCPGLQSEGAPDGWVAGRAPASRMPGCDQPDAASPGLCHAHCLDGKSSLDKAEVPTVTPAAVIVSTILLPLQPPLALPQPAAAQASFLQRTTAPPIAIRHCCFRL